MDKYFAPDFSHRNSGTARSRAELAEIYLIGRYAEDGRFSSLNEAGFPVEHP
ncbi:hypothetical protein VSH64_39220 [Amycolatopsis rhabdoformis]|uniref:Uncharacterized protein n=1 Tax=Amycolatopsis rhabdoformis TaxID=1448059 RepID=A0ABZ1I4D2_9PSEU|nr:hypothetical protein [Amycolatopsis rhabdoformis]WSE28806.1 hypothetical protein VSH64_39220 [Amycolatopsis rhabdoformis]